MRRHLLRPHLLVLPKPHPLVGHEDPLHGGGPFRLGQPSLHHKVPHGVLHSHRLDHMRRGAMPAAHHPSISGTVARGIREKK
eukprot:CAMPEP_0204268964 /NCGR_PEP_ID=MMETSP0468-20130131/15356_1 /ASSEMBLY_ACC=CAM_ASM_000383 /TAXON_ID=2969 /ORGANISM="Oxyrrhis marina" /LENGTH=81 /DNA_ID=CAMNT_0051244293 /DNA_START=79 /DNA_END=324 /DNA_ORIENTATION=-